MMATSLVLSLSVTPDHLTNHALRFVSDWSVFTVCDILDQLSDKPMREWNFFEYIHMKLSF
jgi:hypothetical protein